jgi:sugar lactone lactonase YvrE
MKRSIGIAVLFSCLAISHAWAATSVTLDTSFVAAGTTVQTVVTANMQAPEGPVWDNTGGAVYFADYTSNIIWKVSGGTGTATQFKTGLNIVCGLVIDQQDRLIFGERSKLSRVPLPAATPVTVLTDSLRGLTAGRTVNDLTLASDGGVFMTDNEWSSECYVYYLPTTGNAQKKLTFASGIFPNGIEYVQDKNLMYITFSQTNSVKKYTVDAQNNLANATNFCTASGPDGIAIDMKGNVYVAVGGSTSIDVFDSTGSKKGSITVGSGSATNCAFGGTDFQTLFITKQGTGAGLYSLHMKIKGRPTTGGTTQAISREQFTPLSPAVRSRTAGVLSISGRMPFAKSSEGLMYSVTGRALNAGRQADGLYFVMPEKNRN